VLVLRIDNVNRHCTFHTDFTFQDPITDPEIGTASIRECRLPDYVTCETTWTGTWVRLP